MSAQLDLNDEYDALARITGSGTGWVAAAQALLRKLAHSSVNPFNSAALRDAGAAAGNVPVLDAQGRLASGVLPSASETQAGIAEFATVAEANTGTATDRAVTPRGLASLFEPQAIFGAQIVFNSDTTAYAEGFGLAVDASTSLEGRNNVSSGGARSGATLGRFRRDSNGASLVYLLLDNSLPAIGPVFISEQRNGAYSGGWQNVVAFNQSGAADLTSTSNRRINIGGLEFGSGRTRAISALSVIGHRASYT